MSSPLKAFSREHQQGEYIVTEFYHTKSVKSHFQHMSPQEFQVVLDLALTSLENFQASATLSKYEEALAHEKAQQQLLFDKHKKLQEDQHQTKLQSLSSSYDFEISQLKSQLAEAKQRSSAAEQSLQSFKENSQTFVQEMMNSVLVSKEAQYQAEIHRLQKLYEGNMKAQQATQDHNLKDQIARLESYHQAAVSDLKQTLQDKSRVLQTLEEELKKHTEKSLVSSERGKVGEQHFEELVNTYTNWTVENVSKKAHNMDCRCKIDTIPVLFEVKNYTSDVPSKEAKKFERDIAEHLDVPFGCFISLNTGIQSKKDGKPFHLTWTPNHQLLLYISYFQTHVPSEILGFLEVCAEIAWSVYKVAQEKPQDQEIVNRLVTQLNTAKSYLDAELSRLSSFLITLSRDKKTLMDMLEKQHAHYINELNQMKMSLKTTIAVLLGTAVQDESLDQGTVDDMSMLAPTPTGKKSKSGVSKKKTSEKALDA